MPKPCSPIWKGQGRFGGSPVRITSIHRGRRRDTRRMVLPQVWDRGCTRHRLRPVPLGSTNPSGIRTDSQRRMNCVCLVHFPGEDQPHSARARRRVHSANTRDLRPGAEFCVNEAGLVLQKPTTARSILSRRFNPAQTRSTSTFSSSGICAGVTPARSPA